MVERAARRRKIDFREMLNDILRAANRSRQGWTEQHLNQLENIARQARIGRGEEERRPLIRELRPSLARMEMGEEGRRPPIRELRPSRELNIIVRRAETVEESLPQVPRSVAQSAVKLANILELAAAENRLPNFRREWVGV